MNNNPIRFENFPSGAPLGAVRLIFNSRYEPFCPCGRSRRLFTPPRGFNCENLGVFLKITDFYFQNLDKSPGLVDIRIFQHRNPHFLL